MCKGLHVVAGFYSHSLGLWIFFISSVNFLLDASDSVQMLHTHKHTHTHTHTIF